MEAGYCATVQLSGAAGPLCIVAVASPYVWDVVESAQRLGRPVHCIDNYGGADPRLPGLRTLAESIGSAGDWTLGISSAVHRGRAATQLVANGWSRPVPLVDPTAIVASTAVIRHGAYVNAAAVIASNTTIGCFSNVNRTASIGHDCSLGFSVSIGPGSVLAGYVDVGASAFVGAGAVVLPAVRIGSGAMVGAGAVVTSDVPPGRIVVGNPARLLEKANHEPIGVACPVCAPR